MTATPTTTPVWETPQAIRAAAKATAAFGRETVLTAATMLDVVNACSELRGMDVPNKHIGRMVRRVNTRTLKLGPIGKPTASNFQYAWKKLESAGGTIGVDGFTLAFPTDLDKDQTRVLVAKFRNWCAGHRNLDANGARVKKVAEPVDSASIMRKLERVYRLALGLQRQGAPVICDHDALVALSNEALLAAETPDAQRPETVHEQIMTEVETIGVSPSETTNAAVEALANYLTA